MALLLVCQDVAAQIELVKNGKARATIVLENPTERDFTAAHILQLFIHRISEAQLPIVTDRKVKKGEIQIGGDCPCWCDGRWIQPFDFRRNLKDFR